MVKYINIIPADSNAKHYKVPATLLVKYCEFFRNQFLNDDIQEDEFKATVKEDQENRRRYNEERKKRGIPDDGKVDKPVLSYDKVIYRQWADNAGIFGEVSEDDINFDEDVAEFHMYNGDHLFIPYHHLIWDTILEILYEYKSAPYVWNHDINSGSYSEYVKILDKYIDKYISIEIIVFLREGHNMQPSDRYVIHPKYDINKVAKEIAEDLDKSKYDISVKPECVLSKVLEVADFLGCEPVSHVVEKYVAEECSKNAKDFMHRFGGIPDNMILK